MRFMNEWDIDSANKRWHAHPVLGPAARTLRNLAEWTNANSDGWAYWPKPCRAAAKLMELIEGRGTHEFFHGERNDATDARLRAALSPIKAFCTRHGVDQNLIISS